MSTTEPPPAKLRSPADIIVTDDDIALELGSGELKACPFCGCRPISTGEEITGRAGKAVRWKIQCTKTAPGSSLIPDCFASVLAVDPDQTKARTTAVERWNRRV